MMAWEFALERLKRKDLANWRKIVTTSETGSLSDIHTPAHKEPGLWMRIWFAQNPAYLEVSNTFWEERVLFYRAAYMGLIAFSVLFWIWLWNGTYVPIRDYLNGVSNHFALAIFGSWLIAALFIPLLLLAYWSTYCAGRFNFYKTQLRGRVRFNRLTRKVYVLRPENCGGNVVLDWDRMQANFRIVNFNPVSGKINNKPRKGDGALFIYHPPDAAGSREECITIGPATKDADGSARAWEYIRQFMEDGPQPGAKDGILQNIPLWGTGYAEFSTYAGVPDKTQYSSETTITGYEAALHMWIQSTCYWPKFPKEWQSDSGLGDPEDKPFETGAMETFKVHRVQGKISQETWNQAMERGWVEAGAPLDPHEALVWQRQHNAKAQAD